MDQRLRSLPATAQVAKQQGVFLAKLANAQKLGPDAAAATAAAKAAAKAAARQLAVEAAQARADAAAAAAAASHGQEAPPRVPTSSWAAATSAVVAAPPLDDDEEEAEETATTFVWSNMGSVRRFAGRLGMDAALPEVRVLAKAAIPCLPPAPPPLAPRWHTSAATTPLWTSPLSARSRAGSSDSSGRVSNLSTR